MSRASQWDAFSLKLRKEFLRNGARPCPVCGNFIYSTRECQVDHIIRRQWCRGEGAHLYNDPENLRIVCKRCKGNNLDNEPNGMLTTNRRRLEKILEAHGQETHDWARGWMERLGLAPDKG
jgi:5-methylcytosine-specific restriction endonuclease McrA